MSCVKPWRNIIADLLWDAWCCVSVVGIWPRFIEPKLLSVTEVEFFYEGLHPDLEEFHIAHFSDLHFRCAVSNRFLKKIRKKIEGLSPDMIVFSGDFLCYSELEDKKRLHAFFASLRAPYGCYYVFGNHDYDKYVGITDEGVYDVIEEMGNRSFIVEGLKKMFAKKKKAYTVSSRAASLSRHENLCALLKKTSFVCLENATEKRYIGKARINISGLGDACLNKACPSRAFEGYKSGDLNIVVVHNPDTLYQVGEIPGDLVLAGHTHGGQVNLPFLRKRFIFSGEAHGMKGAVEAKGKKMFISRGIGSPYPFRWFVPPEIASITLKRKK
jgi:uncharacterized protein